MNANHPLRRLLLAASAANFAVGAAVCAAVLLYVDPHGVPRVAATLLVGLLVVGVAAGRYLKQRAASTYTGGSRLTSSIQPREPTPYPPRQTSDDYWYPAAATRDRSGARPRGPGRDPDVAHLHATFESSDAARQARFQREMDRIHRHGGGPG